MEDLLKGKICGKQLVQTRTSPTDVPVLSFEGLSINTS